MTRYRLVPEEIIEAAKEYTTAGVDGRPPFSTRSMQRLLKAIAAHDASPVFVPSDAQVAKVWDAVLRRDMPFFSKSDARAAILAFIKAVAEEPAERASGDAG